MTQVSKDIQDELDGYKQSDKNNECFKTGETNTINFVKADGSQQMFPYSQLITAWTEHTDEENVIKVFFSTHQVTIKGLNLSVIYKTMTNQNLLSLSAQDQRYLKVKKQKKAFIKRIKIEWSSNSK